MEKLIDSNAYYVESKKAIDIAMAKDIRFRQKLDPKERLEIYTRYMKETTDSKEYRVLKDLKDDLEMKIKFNDTAEPVVPEEDQEKIKRNVEIEQQAAVEKTNELKAQLSDLLADFEKEALPLIKVIGEMEDLQVIPSKIDAILSHELREKFDFSLQAQFSYQRLNVNDGRAREAQKQLEDSISYLRNTTAPVQAKKSLLLNFLKGGK